MIRSSYATIGSRCFGPSVLQDLLPLGGIDTIIMNAIMFTTGKGDQNLLEFEPQSYLVASNLFFLLLSDIFYFALMEVADIFLKIAFIVVALHLQSP